MAERPGLTYASSGVDMAAGDRAVTALAPLVRSTYRPEVLGDVGGFGGLFAMPAGYREPVLVAGTDGVGTKLAVATALDRWDAVGLDLVAMCVDDLVCQGAAPLFFLDYQALGRVDPDQVRDIVSGIAEGCRQAGCALIGGELAEHPGASPAVDLVGFAVGVVERSALIDGQAGRPGDTLIGLPSPGLRSNGYSLARRALLDEAGRSLDEPAWAGAGSSLGEELLRPSVIYTPAVLAVLGQVEVHGIAHITGGGIPGNVPRALPAGCRAVLRRRSWTTPRIFDEVQRAGRVSDEEMARVFNLGLGMVLALPPGRATDAALGILAGAGHDARVVGEVVEGPGDALIEA